MSLISNTDFTKPQNTYLVYKRMFDMENGTDYAKKHYEMFIKNVDTEESSDFKQIEYNNGAQRNIVGNYNDNEILIKKAFNHLNAMKRAQTLSQQTNDEYARLLHENIQYRERDALELTLRTLQSNIRNH